MPSPRSAGARSHPTLVAIAAFCLAAAPASAQQPPVRTTAEGGFGGEVAVTVVNLDVMVHDRDGAPVEGLTAADFRVLQDGVEMPISNFAAFAAATAVQTLEPAAIDARAAVGEASSVAPRRPPVSMVLFIDSANLHPLQRNRVLDRVTGFVRRHLSPPVRMMVVTASPHLEVRQGFTDDPELVVAALGQAARQAGGRSLRDLEQYRILEWLDQIDSDRRSSWPDFTSQPDIVLARAQLQGQITSWIQEESFAVRDALTRVGEAIGLLAGLEGRRSLLHISSGLPLTPGAALLQEFSTVFRDPSIFSRAPRTSLADDFRSLAVTASRASVSLYTLDASGLAPPAGLDAAAAFAPGAMSSAIDRGDLQDSLRYLAESTGGLAIVDTNDPTAGLERIARDHDTWYSLGYTVSRGPGSDVAHRLEVQLPGRPTAIVRTRRWFVETSLETRLLELVLGQLGRDLETNPMELELTASADAASEGARRVLPVRLSVPLRHLPLVEKDDGFLVALLEVCVVVGDDRGRRSPPSLRTVEVRVPGDGYRPDLDQRFALDLRLAVRDRDHTVAVGVLDRASGLVSATRVRALLE